MNMTLYEELKGWAQPLTVKSWAVTQLAEL